MVRIPFYGVASRYCVVCVLVWQHCSVGVVWCFGLVTLFCWCSLCFCLVTLFCLCDVVWCFSLVTLIYWCGDVMVMWYRFEVSSIGCVWCVPLSGNTGLWCMLFFLSGNTNL